MDTISQIKQKLDIVDVISSYISLKKAGKNYKAVCPFHTEDTPSFMVSPDLQIFKCFGCGEGGDMFNFVEKMEGVEFSRALEILADRAGVKIEQTQLDPNYKKKKLIYEINNLTEELYQYLLLSHKAGKSALQYLKKDRNLKLPTIKKYKLGYAPDKWDLLNQFLTKKGYTAEDQLLAGVVMKKRSGGGYIDKFRGRVMFPLIDTSDRIIGFTSRDFVGRDPKYLNTQETMVFDKSSFLYGLNLAKAAIKKKGAVFVEGQVDVVIAHQNKIENVVASSGTSLTSVQLKIISRYTKELVFCFDSDNAGISATQRALDLANQHDLEVKVVMIPSKYADLDEYLNKDPKEARNALNNPVPIYDFYLASALRTYDITSAFGKKQVVEYLQPAFSRIKNKVVFDHYIKELEEKTDINEEVLREAFSQKTYSKKASHKNVGQGSIEGITVKRDDVKNSAEDYLFVLILKADLDTMGQILYKLDSQDFLIEYNQQIFQKLKEYIDSKPEEFDIKYYIGTLEEKIGRLVSERYLWNLDDSLSSERAFARELEATFNRVKNTSIKRELKHITEQIKLAELEKNSKLIKELSEKFTELSKKLL